MSQSISQKFTPISLLKFALPSMVMMMFMSCYTIVDGIFISRYLGSEALSAANIVYPVFNLLLAVGIMFATGGSAVVSKNLGRGKRRGHGGLLVSHCSRSGAQCTFDDRHITFFIIRSVCF